jgi:hypothetical protein
MFSGGAKEKSEDEDGAEGESDPNTEPQSAEAPPKTSESEANSANKTATEESPKSSDSKTNETESTKNGTETPEAVKNATKPPSIKPPPKFIRTKLTLDVDQKYSSLSTKQIGESTRVLGEFEKAERAKRDLEVASNALESLVYDTAVKLDEEWLGRKDFVEDFKVSVFYEKVLFPHSKTTRLKH